jgi:hypothetical protein
MYGKLPYKKTTRDLGYSDEYLRLASQESLKHDHHVKQSAS